MPLGAVVDAVPREEQGEKIALTCKVVIGIAVLQAASIQQAAHDLPWLAEFSRVLGSFDSRKKIKPKLISCQEFQQP